MTYLPCHQFQRDQVSRHALVCGGDRKFGPILNVGCKEDCAHLGSDFDAINLDVEDYDIETQTDLYSVPNFVRGSALNLPFTAGEFIVCVIGELLEHCLLEEAILVLSEASRVITPAGRIIVTFPLDSRPKELQRPPHELRVYESNITSWHQSIWDDDSLADLLWSVGLEEEYREVLRYKACDYGVPCFGLGLVLRKKSC